MGNTTAKQPLTAALGLLSVVDTLCIRRCSGNAVNLSTLSFLRCGRAEPSVLQEPAVMVFTRRGGGRQQSSRRAGI
jgi:hypothetical protein